MIVLAIDTASALCAACIYDSDAEKELGRTQLDLGKGHAEHLMTVIADALAQAGLDFGALDRIVIAVGPGSFTGVRVGVATARGLALALKIPAVGVTTLEGLAAQARAQHPGSAIMVALDGGRGEINVEIFDEAGLATNGPVATTIEGAAILAKKHKGILIGSASAEVANAASVDIRIVPGGATADIGVYARLGVDKSIDVRPKPLYLREADAKPQAGFVLPRIRS
ncbi:MAG: tRNA (adenosine(37)-N6)-threonylcarbamoyltransferase complex dimerization subunit type 1 TsaB [Rhizobiaceae bacterium]|nr:tRNA (adenosine(37)-N6)-threonylcarbamoyltransferase complex dimerization subunit type 1 TsaB [Rhizobiaceae bacterium]